MPEQPAEVLDQVTEATETTEAVETTEETEAEGRARRMGWRPKEEYNGPEDRWVPADRFVERAETEAPIMRERLRHQDRQIQEMQKAMQEQSGVMRKAAENARMNQLRAIKAAQAEAVSEGDADKFRQLDGQYEQLRQTQLQMPDYQPPPPEEAPEFKAWVKRNEWYEKDLSMRSYAESAGAFVKAQNPQLEGLDFLDAVKAEVQQRFPGAFTPQQQPPAVEGGRQLGGRSPTKKSYSDLPAEAKSVCDKFVKTIPGFTRAQYTKDYFGE